MLRESKISYRISPLAKISNTINKLTMSTNYKLETEDMANDQ